MHFRRRAFTMIELVMTIGILMILIGLLLPSLARTRELARQTQSAANLRTIGQTMIVYSSRYADWMPVGEVRRTYPASYDGGISMSFGNHFDFGRNWPLLFRDVAPWEEFYSILFSPGTRPPERGQSAANRFSYRYSHSFLARPELWRPGALSSDRLLTGVRHTDILFPSSKVLAWDGRLSYLLRPELLGTGDMLANPTPMLFSDGHVDVRRPGGAVRPVPNVMNANTVEGRQPLHNTPLGVRGRDFE
jgi:type II secretory pathway pseudopilin PulG